jgi:hypothetical protein
MNDILKHSKTYYTISIGFVLLILILHLFDEIKFGYGLADLVFMIIEVVTISGAIILLKFIKRKKTFFKTSILIFTITFFLIFKFTFGRGKQYPWNGNILNNKQSIIKIPKDKPVRKPFR